MLCFVCIRSFVTRVCVSDSTLPTDLLLFSSAMILQLSRPRHKSYHEDSRPGEAVRPFRPWSDQNFTICSQKSYICKILIGPIIVWSRFFSNGRTNLALLPPPLRLIRLTNWSYPTTVPTKLS